MGKLIQLHERRTTGQKLRTRDERWQKRMTDLRKALHDQWQLEEAKYQAQLQELRAQVAALSQQVVSLATQAMDKDAGAIIKETADMIVRITQGDYQPGAVEQVNIADTMYEEAGGEMPAGLFIPEHERESLDWAAAVFPTRGDFLSQEEGKIIGADD